VGVQGYTHNFGNGTTASSVGWAVDFLSYNPGPNFGTLTNYAHFYAGPPVNARGTQAQNTFGFYADDQGSGANNYASRFLGGKHFWSQGTNGLDVLKLQRATDTSPTGSFINFIDAAGGCLWKVDITGQLTCGTIPSARVSGLAVVATSGSAERSW
jgi:hypothetical protein